MQDKILLAADAIAKVFNETAGWLDPKRSAIVQILKGVSVSKVPVEAAGLKMVITFKDGIALRELPDLQKVIDSLGGKAVFVPQTADPTTDIPVDSKTKPYLEELVQSIEYSYNPEYGDDRVCTCEHHYYRHFDTYEKMRNVGCKYCRCTHFEEAKPETK